MLRHGAEAGWTESWNWGAGLCSDSPDRTSMESEEETEEQLESVTHSESLGLSSDKPSQQRLSPSLTLDQHKHTESPAIKHL